MANLKWMGKKERKNFFSKINKITPFHILDIYPSINFDPKSEDNWQNLMVWGENETVMNLLLEKFENKIKSLLLKFFKGL